MVATLNGIAFDQVYGDNSGGAEFDTDGDGTATQEDEFVSFTNTTGAPVDVSGWEVWSDWIGSGAPDSGQDGLYHTFPPGTVIQPGDTLYVINEISGSAPGWAQEASEGGVESGPGGQSTNFLGEGYAGSNSEAIFLVDPDTGDYLVFNLSSSPPDTSTMAGFTGTNQVGVIDGDDVEEDQNAGFSHQYDATDGEYEYAPVYVPCFAAGTLIETAAGPRRIEDLTPGNTVSVRGGGSETVVLRLGRSMAFKGNAHPAHKPIRIPRDAFGPGQPRRTLRLSPQHRVMLTDTTGREVLVPAKALVGLCGIRQQEEVRQIIYHHLVLDRHHVLRANGLWCETFLPGPYSLRSLPPRIRRKLHMLGLAQMAPYRPLLSVAEARRLCPLDRLGLGAFADP